MKEPCDCYNCKECKIRLQTASRLWRFRKRKKGLPDIELTDEQLEERLNNYYNSISIPDYEKIQVTYPCTLTASTSIPTWIRLKDKWRELHSGLQTRNYRKTF